MTPQGSVRGIPVEPPPAVVVLTLGRRPVLIDTHRPPYDVRDYGEARAPAQPAAADTTFLTLNRERPPIVRARLGLPTLPSRAGRRTPAAARATRTFVDAGLPSDG